MTEVAYTGDWQRDVRKAVEEILSQHVHLVPGWCRSLYVRFESGDANDSAMIRINYEYRHAVMYVRPAWFEESPQDREKAILHEIMHLHVQPMKNVFHDLCGKMIVDQGVRDFAFERFNEALEGSVEDLAWAFYLKAGK